MKLLFGYGYLGSRIAELWKQAESDVTIVTRSTEKAYALRAMGFRTFIADVSKRETLESLPQADTVLFSVGFDRSDGQSVEQVQTGGVRNVLDALPKDTGRFIHISTTGVYGSSEGAWIDENTAPAPQRPGGLASLESERAIREHDLGRNAIVLRLAGIYGPGRIPFLRQLKVGEPISAPSEGHLNLIHVDDAAQCVLAAEQIEVDDGPEILNVCDGSPVIRSKFYGEIAQNIGATTPAFSAADPESGRSVRARGDKRISNDRMRAKLRVNLSYPSYRKGLAKILADGDKVP